MLRKDHVDELESTNRRADSARRAPVSRPTAGHTIPEYYESAESFLDAEADGGKGVRDYVDIIVRGFWIILLVWTLVFAIVVVYNYSLSPVYRSSATIEIERFNWRPKQGLGSPENMDFAGYFATQVQILKSRGLAEDFLTHAKLWDSPHVVLSENEGLKAAVRWVTFAVNRILGRQGIQPGTDSPVDRRNTMINSLVKSIEVKRVRDTDLAEVSLEANDGATAQKLLQGYLDLYLERNLEKRRNDHLKASAWLKGELDKVQQKLMKSESTLLEFITENGIVSRDGGFGDVMQLVNKSLERVRQSKETRTRIEAMQDQSEPVPSGTLAKASGGQLLGTLKQQLAQLESEYSELGGLYSPSSPKMALLNKRMQFLKNKIAEVETTAMNSALDQAKSEERFLKETLDEAKKEAARVNALEARLGLLKKDVDADRQFYNMILKEYKEMDIRAGTLFNNISLVDPPRKPAEPVRPRTIFNLLIGALVGLAGGLVAAAMVDSMDNTVRSPRDIDTDLRVRRLGIVPDLSRQLKGRNAPLAGSEYELLAHDEPRSPLSDAIKNIQTSIFLAHPTDMVRSMIVSSATPSEGKTFISVSIATVLSSGSNKKTLLVDADLRKPRIHKVFGRNNTGPGLSTLLTADNVKLKDVVHSHRIPRFFYITSGPVPVDPVSLLKSERMAYLLDYLSRIFDYIVFDSPPVLGFADTQILCRSTDGMIMVAKQGHVGRQELREAMNRITSIQGGKILGVVLNKANPRRGRYGYGGYYYYYSKNYKYYRASDAG
jgi:polysaccharide biosynthesis transport protein